VSPRFLATPRRRRRKWLLLGAAVVLLAAVVLGYGYAETYRLEVKEYIFTSPDLPAAFDGTRIVLVTDIHCGRFFSQDRVSDVVDRVHELDPDLIVLGGDFVFAQMENAEPCFAELARLQAPLGVFAVLGNHDHGEYDRDDRGPQRVLEAAEKADIPVLVNQAVWVEKAGDRIRVGGVDDHSTGRPQLGPIVSGTETSDFVLLASHNPDFSERIPAGTVDLVLSGHTHGGQVTLFGLWAFHVPSEFGQKYRTGMVVNDTTTVVVSNGVGTSTFLPIRILARPQIVVVTVRSGVPATVQP
jgi:predicted MPP superfamily phosphohydrolase